MDDLLREFLTETSEGLALLDQEIIKLEKTPNDPALLDSIFRIVHTIKGTCGFLGLPRLELVAHASENLLGKFRDGAQEVSPQSVTLILESLDQIKSILAVLEETEAEPKGDDQDLIARLNAVAEGGEADPASQRADDAPRWDEPEVSADSPLAAETPVEIPQEALVDAAVSETAEAEAETETVSTALATSISKESAVADSAMANKSIRVNVDLLENLMTMVSELVLTRNQLLQILRTQDDSEFTAPLQRLNHVTSELQEGVMKTRMQPIGNAWAKLPRVVRDLALDLGKKIELTMHGEETELDRQLLELIKDPLTHMVRNSADHGIEAVEDRISAGKPEQGTITLDARHEGGHIIIEITDDGRGIDSEKVKAKALERGLVSQAQIKSMSDQQIQQFVFMPGFSTAAQVTNVSGRGVGMDVVRTNIEKIGGTVELSSAAGRGSAFTIKIPLTLAIVNSLIVESCGERFAIPQISVVELVRATESSDQKIEWINDAPVLRLRNRLLPLVPLSEMLRLEENRHDTKESDFIIVTQVGTHHFGIIVDRVYDTEEIVVKPVAPILRDISLFSGNTILGDGSVVMILDPNGIAAACGDVTVAAENQLIAEGKAAPGQALGDKTSLLVFRASASDAPFAVPLSLVSRLEEVQPDKVEISNGKPVVQYRGKLMPLITLDGGDTLPSEGRMPVLVFSDGSRSMGLVVSGIVDIVEDVMDVELGTDKRGMIGSAIIGDKATDIIDAGHYMMQAFEDFGPGHATEDTADHANSKILLVDDSPFFRNLLTPLLRVAGYDVTAVDSALAALDLCRSGTKFDVIVSDLDMPEMTGYQLAEKIREDERWSGTPILALSQSASPRDLDRGRTAGFNDFIAKFDRDALLQSLSETIGLTRGAA